MSLARSTPFRRSYQPSDLIARRGAAIIGRQIYALRFFIHGMSTSFRRHVQVPSSANTKADDCPQLVAVRAAFNNAIPAEEQAKEQ